MMIQPDYDEEILRRAIDLVSAALSEYIKTLRRKERESAHQRLDRYQEPLALGLLSSGLFGGDDGGDDPGERKKRSDYLRERIDELYRR